MHLHVMVVSVHVNAHVGSHFPSDAAGKSLQNSGKHSRQWTIPGVQAFLVDFAPQHAGFSTLKFGCQKVNPYMWGNHLNSSGSHLIFSLKSIVFERNPLSYDILIESSLNPNFPCPFAPPIATAPRISAIAVPCHRH